MASILNSMRQNNMVVEEEGPTIDLGSIFPLLTCPRPLMESNLEAGLLAMLDGFQYCFSHYHSIYTSTLLQWDADISKSKRDYQNERDACITALSEANNSYAQRWGGVWNELDSREEKEKEQVNERFNRKEMEAYKWRKENYSKLEISGEDRKINRHNYTLIAELYDAFLSYLGMQAPIKSLAKTIVLKDEVQKDYSLYKPNITNLAMAESALKDFALMEANKHYEKIQRECERVFRSSEKILSHSKEIVRIYKDADEAVSYISTYNREKEIEKSANIEKEYKNKLEYIKKERTQNLEKLEEQYRNERINLEKKDKEEKEELRILLETTKERDTVLEEKGKKAAARLREGQKDALEQILTDFANVMEIVFPKEGVQLFYQKIRCGIDYNVYTEGQQVSNICIGMTHVALDLGNNYNKQFYKAACQLYETNYTDIAKQTEGKLQLSLPFFVSIEEGVKLFLKHGIYAEPKIKEVVNMIGIRVMMNIPASLLEFCLIDNAALGSFAELMSLNPAPAYRGGDSKAKNILLGDEVQKHPSGIKKQIGAMWTRYNNLISSFNERDISLRIYNENNVLSRETYQFVFAQHFPTGFDSEVITQMIALTRDCGSAGYSAIIAMPDDTRRSTEPAIEQIQGQMEILEHIDGRRFSIKTRNKCKCGQKLIVEMYENFSQEKIEALKKEVYEESVNGKRLLVSFDSIVSRETEHFRASGMEEISVRLGTLQGGAKFMINMNDAHVNTLLSGSVRSGKSNLLRVFLTNLLLNYSPAEVEVYLIDYKNGDDFSLFSSFRIPHLKMINLANEPCFVMMVFEELQREIDRRKTLLSKHMNINEYNRRNPDNPMKRIVVVIDELYILVNDAESKEISLMNRKVMDIIDLIAHEHGGYGVHMFLAAQEITKVNEIEKIIEMCANRILLQTTSQEVSSLFRGRTEAMDLMNGISPEQKGVCVYTDNFGKSESLAYTAELAPEQQEKWLSYISDAYKGFSSYTTILSTDPSLDKSHPLTHYIEQGEMPKGEIGLMIGESLRLDNDSKFVSLPKKSLWILGGDRKAEYAGRSAMYYSVISLLLMKIQYKKNGKEIRLICCNGMDENLGMLEQNDRFGQLCSDPVIACTEEDNEGLVEYIYNQDIKDKIASVYQCSRDRLENGKGKAEPVWMIIQQMELCWNLDQNDMIMLHDIIRNGDRTDIHLIIWTRTAENSELYQLAKSESEMLVLETDSLDGFMINRKNLHIGDYVAQHIAQRGATVRIYDYPVIPQVEAFLNTFS